MAIVVRNTNYNGEVLEKILVLACTGNDLVEKGLIMVIPGVEKKISLPRIKTGKMLQKRKENPGLEDSKGNFNYSEKSLDPEDFMAFTTFNPRAFEHIWRKWQPKGNLVFAELPPEAQNTLLDELSKSVKFELGWHYINGEFGSDDDHLFNGILTQAAKDSDVIVVPAPADTSMIGKLKAVRKAIPKALRENPNLRILMSIDDFSASAISSFNFSGISSFFTISYSISPVFCSFNVPKLQPVNSNITATAAAVHLLFFMLPFFLTLLFSLYYLTHYGCKKCRIYAIIENTQRTWQPLQNL